MRYTVRINNAVFPVASVESARRLVDMRGGIGVICDKWGIIVARHKAR